MEIVTPPAFADGLIDLTDLTPTEGFIIQGQATADQTGHSVSSAGDVNGDGIEDIIIGAPTSNYSAADSGQAYVVFGTDGGFGATVNGRQVVDLNNLNAAQGLIINGGAAGDQLGRAVSSAGDVNGDGFDDIIVSATYNDEGGSNAGQSYVVFGGAVAGVVDVSALSAAEGFVIRGDVAHDQAGYAISSAGDINGDGFDDLIVGARLGDDGGTNAGEAYVVFGTDQGFGVDIGGRQVIDLTNHTADQGFIIQGHTNGDEAGRSVSSAGDFNGDGFDDLIVGAPRNDQGGTDAGQAYLIFGTADGFGSAVGTEQVLDLSGSLTGVGFIIRGEANTDWLGRSVSGAGDINGDGFDDIVVGAPYGDDGGTNAGEAYVIFGGDNTATIDVTTLSAAQGFIIKGDVDGDFAGWSVSSAGDINGDGLADLIIGARGNDNGGTFAGAAYVVFGSDEGFGADVSGRQVIDLSTLTPDTGFTIQGDVASDQAGISVSVAGDINGDGFDDLIVGADQGSDAGSLAGEAYVIYGGPTGALAGRLATGTAGADVLRTEAGDDTIIGNGGADVVRAGAGDDQISVSDLSFADIDGGLGTDTLSLDGAGLVLDLTATLPAEITSIERIDITGSGANELTLNGLNVFDITEQRENGVAVLTVDGAAEDVVSLVGTPGGAGFSLAGTVVEGAVTYNRYTEGSAEVRVAQGVSVSLVNQQGFADGLVDVTNLDPNEGFIVQGDAAGDDLGSSVSSLGDINGDGFADFVVGAKDGNGGGASVGAAYIIFGTDQGFGAVDGTGRKVIDTTNLTAAEGFIIQGDAVSDSLGYSVSSAGDVNGDGFMDIIVGARLGDDGGSNAGEAYIVFGTDQGFGVDVSGRQVIDVTNLTADQGFIIQGDAANDHLGTDVSSAGDINGDGFDDLVVGAPLFDRGGIGGADFGEAYVIFGTDNGFGEDVSGRQVIDVASVSTQEGFIIRGVAQFDQAGRSVSSAGDVNGDGIDDLVVGADGAAGGAADAGRAYIIYGRTDGFGSASGDEQMLDLASFSSDDGFFVYGDVASDRLGISVSSAGDINGDGFDDLVVGAPYGDDGGSNAGEAYVIFGGDSLANTDTSTLDASQGFIIRGDNGADQAGFDVSSAGDINGDGYNDIIVGARLGDDGGTNAGEAYVIFGTADGFGVDVGGRQVIDLSTMEAETGFRILGEAGSDYLGKAVSGAGDINGDGYDDLVVGAPYGDDGGSSAGEAYVIYGGPTGAITAETITGTAGADQLIGNAGDDTITGNGGGDVIRGGAGDDDISVSDLSFVDIQGGAGTDVLRLDGAGMTLDLTDGLQSVLTSIERIDLTGTGDNALRLNALNLFDLTEQRANGVAVLTVDGDAGDSVTLIGGAGSEGWMLSGTVVDGAITYNRYTEGNAELRVAQDVTVETVIMSGFTDGFVNLTDLAPGEGFIIQGDAAGDESSWSVSSAGDVNGDGFEDIVVGARFGDDGGTDAGETYVVFGSASGFGAVDGTGRRVLDLTSLSAAEGFIVQGDAAGDSAGISVASAGDVNGDGFDDIIVGARYGDDGGTNAGESYVVFGTDSGFGVDISGRQVVDLTFLNAAQGYVIQGDAAGDDTGWSVSSAGDVNGDGFDDVVVGARFGDDGGADAGEAYVLFGTDQGFGANVSGRQVIDLTSLSAAEGFIVQGDAAGDNAGYSVSSAGDINGDGYDDIIVGARLGDDGGTHAGEAYVVFGSAEGFGADVSGRQVIDLTSITPAQGFLIQGDVASDQAGASVASAGDVNGDGFDDLIVGARLADDAGTNAGEAYVLFGRAAGFGTTSSARQVMDLSNFSADDGFIIQGDSAGDQLGMGVSSAGDFNGDGFDDILVGARLGDDGGTDAGEAYVIFGTEDGFGVDVSGRQIIDLSTLTAEVGFRIQGDSAADQLGHGVSSAGDVNGDGFDDLIVAARYGDDGGANAGESYVIYGGPSVQLSDGTPGADILVGTSGNDTLTGMGGADSYRGGAGDDTISVADLNFADIDGGAGSDTLRLEGAGQTLDLTSIEPGDIKSIERIDLTGSGDNSLILNPLNVLDITGERANGQATLTVDGDTGDAVTLFSRAGGTGFSLTGTIAEGGITYDIYTDGNANVRIAQGITVNTGNLAGFADGLVDTSVLASDQGFVIQGDAVNDQLGFAVSFAGDVNGDGFQDIIVGARLGDDGGTDAGEAYVVFGTDGGFGAIDGTGRRVIDLTTLSALEGFIIQGDSTVDQFGRSVSYAGDVNGDGFDDLIIGMPLDDTGGNNAGQSYVVFGTDQGFGADVSGRQVVDVATLSATEGFVIQGDSADDQSGFSVSSAGDIDGDGYDDLIIGAWLEDTGGLNSGEAYIIFGSPDGFGSTVGSRQVVDLTDVYAHDGFRIQGDINDDRAGVSVSSAGDVNGDGFDDLVIGANLGDDGGSNAGEAYVIFGTDQGFGVNSGGELVVDLSALSGAEGFIIQGDAANDQAGWRVASAGDINGDGFDDVVVGARYGDDGGTNAGESYVVFGTDQGFGVDVSGRQVVDLTTLSAAEGFIIQGDSAGDTLGWGVSSAGDVNGDGIEDLIVSARLSDDAGSNAGEAYVVFGTENGFGEDVGGRQVIDLTTLTAQTGFAVRGDAANDQLGYSVSAAGDVNGDGFDDIIVGAPYGDDGGINAGEAYVIYGGPTGLLVAETLDGTAGADTLIGDFGDDTITGNGGADVIRGGAGDDIMGVSDASFADIDGGAGTDTLRLDGAGIALDLTETMSAGLSSIERIDLTGSGDNSLTLDALSVQDLSEVRSTGMAALTVDGDSGDAVTLIGAPGEAGWSLAGMLTIDSITYNVYEEGNVQVRIAQAISVETQTPVSFVDGRIDLSDIAPETGFIVQGAVADDRIGYSVSSAGDVNGDGFDDFIVGTERADTAADNAGEAYVIFGSETGIGAIDGTGRKVLDLATLSAAEGFIIEGDAIGDHLSGSLRGVSSAGDVNGDGIDDIIVGAPGADTGGIDAGEAYVIFGTTGVFGVDVAGRQVIDVGTLSAAEGFVVLGSDNSDFAGASVSSAGDINGDGFDDVIIGARLGDDGGSSAGEAYIVYGSGDGFGTDVGGRQIIDLQTFTPSQGFIVQGDVLNSQAGWSVSSAGDFNGDGFDDFIVGAPLNDDGGVDTGEAYVIFGGADGFGVTSGNRQVLDLTGFGAPDGLTIRGDLAGDQFGTSVSSIGDINGDGYDDIIVGASHGDDAGSAAGEAYVIYGGNATGFMDVTTFNASEGFIIQGDWTNDRAGRSVSSAGDVNGDGFQDIIVGAYGGDDGGSGAGEAYVIFGSADGFGVDVSGRQVLDLSTMTAETGFVIQGDMNVDSAGRGVSGVGDINGDGFDDLIVGAPLGDDAGANAGEAYVIYGGTTATLTAQTLDGTAGADSLIGDIGDDTINGNGGADVIRAGAGDDVISVSDLSFFTIDGGRGSDTLSLNGAGLTLDLALNVPAEISSIERIDLTGSGGNTLYLSALNVFDLTEERENGVATLTVDGAAGDNVVLFTMAGDPSWTAAGTVVDGAVTYDVYTQGNATVRIAQDISTDTAEVAGFVDGFVDVSTLDPTQGLIVQGDDAGDQTGFSVSSAGDVNGDGFADFIVSAHLADVGAFADAGEAYVVFGTDQGLGAVDGTGRKVLDLTNLSAAEGFVIQGHNGSDQLGRGSSGVSSAGDINGDGFDDIVVGALFGDDGGVNAGEAYVVFGTAGGFGANVGGRQVIDVGVLSASEGFVIQGHTAHDNAGYAVSTAGDINGDGFDDLIVSAISADGGGSSSGEAYIVYGTVDGFGTDVGGRQVIDITNLTPSEGFYIQGDVLNSEAGRSVSSAGDFNGDGYDDLVIGANGNDDGGADTGEAYVIFGGADGFGVPSGNRQLLDLTGFGAPDGLTIRGDLAGDQLGFSVSSLGDINGDGYDDIIVGAPFGDDGGTSAGEAYVIYGGDATGFMDLTTLSAAEGFIIQGDTGSDFTGFSVSSAGDVNGDGYDDMIVGAQGGDNGGANAGEAYVVFGSADGFGEDVSGRQVLDLSALTPQTGFVIEGDVSGDELGRGVSSAGDINGDGFDDLIVGARYGDDGGTNAGEAYVIYGGPTTLLTAETIIGTASAESLIGGADNDVIAGNGGADVIRGGAGDDIISVSDLSFVDIDGGTGTDKLRLQGSGLTLDLTTTLPADLSSIEVIDITGAGANTIRVDALAVLDLTEQRTNGSGVVYIEGNTGDVATLVGAPGETGWQLTGSVTEAGVTYDVYEEGAAQLRIAQDVFVEVVPQAEFATGLVDLSNLGADDGFIIQGEDIDDRLGYGVSFAGDINGDGFDDIIVSARYSDGGGLNAGDAYVLFGTASGFGADVNGSQVVDLSTLSAADGFLIQGDAPGDHAGRSVSSVGDINGDGFDDIIVGAAFGDDGGSDAGEAYVVYGTDAGFGATVGGRQVIDLSFLSAAEGFILQGAAAGDLAGYSVSSAGDVNGDGYDDLIVGAPGGDDGGADAGLSYVVFGTENGFGVDVSGRQVVDFATLSAVQGFVVQGDIAGDRVGHSVSSVGDVNGDGFDDLIIGAPNGDDGGADAGEAYVLFGTDQGFGASVSGRQVIDLTSLSASEGFIIQGDEAGDQAGRSVSSAGDINGDGFDDIIIGAPTGDDAGGDAGEAYIVFGTDQGFGFASGGRRVLDLSILTPAAGFIVQGAALADNAGWSVSSAGDINGDGFDDLLIGAQLSDEGGVDAGDAYVVFGSADGIGETVSGRQVLDLAELTPTGGFRIQGDTAGDMASRNVSAGGDIDGDGFDDLIVSAPYSDNSAADAGEAYVIFGASTGALTGLTVAGTAGADSLVGDAGDDTLTGNGGADVIRGGAGDDTIVVSDLSFADIDGGTGTDTLSFDGAALALDLTASLPAEITSIERIDLTGTGDNSLTIDTLAVLDLVGDRSGGNAILTIIGDMGDSVTFADAGWVAAGQVIDGADTFNVYTNGAAEVRLLDSVAKIGDPILIDLDGDGLSFQTGANAILFDLDADGIVERTAWAGAGDGVLVVDLDGSGAIEDGREVISEFFGEGGFANSVDALASLDENDDGLIDATDAAFATLQVWNDLNEDGVSQAEELLTLDALGIEAFDLNVGAINEILDGQHIAADGEVQYKDGMTGDFYAVGFTSTFSADAFRGFEGMYQSIFGRALDSFDAYLNDTRFFWEPYQEDISLPETLDLFDDLGIEIAPFIGGAHGATTGAKTTPYFSVGGEHVEGDYPYLDWFAESYHTDPNDVRFFMEPYREDISLSEVLSFLDDLDADVSSTVPSVQTTAAPELSMTDEMGALTNEYGPYLERFVEVFEVDFSEARVVWEPQSYSGRPMADAWTLDDLDIIDLYRPVLETNTQTLASAADAVNGPDQSSITDNAVETTQEHEALEVPLITDFDADDGEPFALPSEWIAA